MSEKSHILFFGELPPHSIHGIAISNKINISQLESSFNVVIIEERLNFLYHDKPSIEKIFKLIRSSFAIVSKSLFQRFEFFYLVYSLSTFGSLKTLMAILNFRISNSGKVILHIHRGDFFSRYYRRFINRILAKIIIGLSHKVIVLSDKQKAEFAVISKKPCFVLPNTVETEYTPEIMQRQNFRFIYISNYLVDKGIIDLLEVFRKLMKQYKNIVLQTFGAFSDNTIKETIFKYNTDRIVINGIISGIDKYKLMANSDCLILPSWNEGQPLVLLEAMSLGTPVIASQVGLIRDMVGADYPYLTIPGSRESLEEKMIQFIMQEDSTQISAVLKERYNKYYSHSKHYASLLEIFS